MLQCEAAMAPASLRLRLLYRMLRAGEMLALVALVSWSSSYVPAAVAAAARLAGSLLLNARFVFVLGNAIVILLYALSRHDTQSSSSCSGDEQQPQQQPVASSAATTLASVHQQVSSSGVPPVAAASGSSFATAPAATLPSSVPSGGAATAACFAAPAEEPRRAVVPAPEPDPVAFEDKNPVVVRVSKAAPRRSRSGKMAAGRAASPELRRCESENGARRRRSSVTARDAEAWREDADEFRRQVESFIARQTRFHREESMMSRPRRSCAAAPAFAGALAVVE